MPGAPCPMSYASTLLGFLPGGRRAPGIAQLISKLESYLPPDHVDRVREAYEYAEAAHKGQKRRSGEPYITHPVAVADVLADLRMDGATIAAAILHDVVEDTGASTQEIAERFGQEIAEIVDGVTKLDQIQFKNRQEAQAESFRKMLLAMVRDIRVIMVKLADRVHNMRTLGAMPPAKRRLVARETLDIYAPIANRLGIHSIKLELEELGFKSLYPKRYRVIEREVKRARGNQKEFLPKITSNLGKALARPASRERSRRARSTCSASTPRCAASGSRSSEVIDVFGVRVVVGTVDECYRVLGLAHAPVPADARPLQGLHRHPAGQRLPVAAHDAVRAERHAHRGADPHDGRCTKWQSPASPRTGPTRPVKRTAWHARSARASG